MAITSEIQKKYGNTERNTGAKTYTLFRGEASDAKPTFAQPGDVFEEYDTGKVYVASRDGKNRTVWTEDASAKRQTESGQTGLPAVTGDDDGKVLTVSDGAWVAAAATSGGGDDYAPLVVTMSDDGSDGLVGDKTFSEIATAASANKPVMIKWSDSTDSIAYNMVSVYVSQEQGQTIYQVSYIEGHAVSVSEGSANDYFVFASS